MSITDARPAAGTAVPKQRCAPNSPFSNAASRADQAERALAESPAAAAELSALLLGLPESDILPWQEDGLCAQTDPEAFFPEKGGSTREAKRVCGRCDVRGECLEYALAHDERFGIWGGLSERERRRLKRRASDHTAEHATSDVA